MSGAVNTAFERSVDEGTSRLNRPLPGLLATGMVGGLDVSVGVFALLIVRRETGDHLLSSMAFGIGFLALTLARSELFTENFLVPVAAVVAKNAPWWSVLRLWGGTAVMNMIGGWVATGLMMMAFADLRAPAIDVAIHPAVLGINRTAFASAILGGVAITLMTWMERATDSIPAKLISAFSMAFVLAAAPLQHAIVISLEMFAALHAGAPFGYLDWLGAMVFAAVGNAIGGVGLVTTLRIIQVGKEEVVAEQERDPEEPRQTEDA